MTSPSPRLALQGDAPRGEGTGEVIGLSGGEAGQRSNACAARGHADKLQAGRHEFLPIKDRRVAEEHMAAEHQIEGSVKKGKAGQGGSEVTIVQEAALVIGKKALGGGAAILLQRLPPRERHAGQATRAFNGHPGVVELHVGRQGGHGTAVQRIDGDHIHAAAVRLDRKGGRPRADIEHGLVPQGRQVEAEGCGVFSQ